MTSRTGARSTAGAPRAGRLPATFAIPILLAIQLAAGGAPARGEPAPVVVSTAWLAEHLQDPGLVVLHVASLRRDYTAGHVPGARFLWTGDVAQGTPEMSFEAVPVGRIRRALESAGVTNRSRIVLCGVNGNVSQTARVFVTMDWLGLGDSTSVLDGQFGAWKDEKRPVSTDEPRARRGSLAPRVRDDVFVKAEWVRDHMRAPGVAIVDARTPNFFGGAPAGQPRSGHIPGARNLPFTTLVTESNALLPESGLLQQFERAGVGANDEIAVYCHVGQTASVVYLAARRLGRRVHLYDGSFDEWGGRVDLPVEAAAPDSTTH